MLEKWNPISIPLPGRAVGEREDENCSNAATSLYILNRLNVIKLYSKNSKKRNIFGLIGGARRGNRIDSYILEKSHTITLILSPRLHETLRFTFCEIIIAVKWLSERSKFRPPPHVWVCHLETIKMWDAVSGADFVLVQNFRQIHWTVSEEMRREQTDIHRKAHKQQT